MVQELSQAKDNIGLTSVWWNEFMFCTEQKKWLTAQHNGMVQTQSEAERTHVGIEP